MVRTIAKHWEALGAYMRRIARLTTDGLYWLASGTTVVLAVFALVNLTAGLARPGADANGVWINTARLPQPAMDVLLAGFGFGVLLHARLNERAALVARLLAGAVAACCLADAVGYYALLAEGRIGSGFPLPLSLPLGLMLAVWTGRAPAVCSPQSGRVRRVARAIALGALALACLLGQVLAFGETDYRRPADAIVVLGAGVRPDGTASQALYDRTMTGCRLYQQGLAKTLIFSGGRDPDAVRSEPQAMREIARRCGIPDGAIILDEQGVNSAATIAFAAELAEANDWDGVLLVSHNYHLSRCKLLADRAALRACTVPAYESRKLTAKGYFVARELAAWAYHYLRPLAG